MRYVFYDLDEQERDLVINVLDHWCVPFKPVTHSRDGLFGTSHSYDIIIDLEPDKIEWVKDKVQERFNLENSFDMPTYKHPPLKNKEDISQHIGQEKTAPSLFEDIFKPNLGIDMDYLKKEQKQTKSIIEEIDDIFENQIKPVSDQIDGDKDKLMDFMDKHGIKDRLKDALRNSLGMTSPDKLKDDLMSYFKDKVSSMLDVGNMLGDITKDGIEITYNELPELMKQDLEKQYGKKLLNSNKCKFIKTKTGIAVIIDETN